nr:RecName: Full=Hemocyanin alpha chain [Tachypleus tridentatus]
TIKEKQASILALFEHLTSVPKQHIPEKERDNRLHDVGHLSRGKLFSLFHREHLEEATHLYEILHAAKNFDDFLLLCKQARDFVNEGM